MVKDSIGKTPLLLRLPLLLLATSLSVGSAGCEPIWACIESTLSAKADPPRPFVCSGQLTFVQLRDPAYPTAPDAGGVLLHPDPQAPATPKDDARAIPLLLIDAQDNPSPLLAYAGKHVRIRAICSETSAWKVVGMNSRVESPAPVTVTVTSIEEQEASADH